MTRPCLRSSYCIISSSLSSIRVFVFHLIACFYLSSLCNILQSYLCFHVLYVTISIQPSLKCRRKIQIVQRFFYYVPLTCRTTTNRKRTTYRRIANSFRLDPRNQQAAMEKSEKTAHSATMGKDLILDLRLKPLVRCGIRNVRVSSSRFRLDRRRAYRYSTRHRRCPSDFSESKAVIFAIS